MRLESRIALITGASRGIGRAIALRFAREGADVVATARSAEALAELRSEIELGGRRCIGIVADLARHGAALQMWQEAVSAVGRVDILVNNAAIGSSSNPRPVASYDDAFWERSLYVNLTVPYLLCKQAARGMDARGYGRIINIASINARQGALHGAAYAASKHGLLGLTRTLALEVSGPGVTVNAICPGPVRTAMNDVRLAYDAERLGVAPAELERSATLLGRRLEPMEVAALAAYLASAEGVAITGQAINVDGGKLMS